MIQEFWTFRKYFSSRDGTRLEILTPNFSLDYVLQFLITIWTVHKTRSSSNVNEKQTHEFKSALRGSHNLRVTNHSPNTSPGALTRKFAVWTMALSFAKQPCIFFYINSQRNCVKINPYPTAFPYGNGMVLHFYQQQENSTTKTVHKVINKGLKTYV